MDAALKELKDALAGTDIEAVKRGHENLGDREPGLRAAALRGRAAGRRTRPTPVRGAGAGASAADDDEVADAEIVDEARRAERVSRRFASRHRTTSVTVAEASADVAEAEAAVESDLSELEQLQGERAELVDTLRRVQADFENYRKRVLREQTALVDRATERLVEDLLPVLDSFDGALGSVGRSDSPETEKVRDGVVGIRTQLVTVLEKAGPRAHRGRRRGVRPQRARSGAPGRRRRRAARRRDHAHRLPPEGPRVRARDGPRHAQRASERDGSPAGVVREGLLRGARRAEGRDREGDHARLPQAREAVPPRREPG